jgi:hypothetical protein
VGGKLEAMRDENGFRASTPGAVRSNDINRYSMTRRSRLSLDLG